MPTLKLAGRSTGTPTRKTAPSARTPKRKPAASKAPARRTAAAVEVEATAPTTRGPKLPDGWSKSDFNRAVKEMQKARAAREAASERLAEAQRAANGMALNLLNEGVQMSVISTELELSRQWLYTLLDKLAEGKIDMDANPIEQAAPARKRAAKPAAKSKPAAKRRPTTKPAAKASAPARKRPPAARGRVRLAA